VLGKWRSALTKGVERQEAAIRDMWSQPGPARPLLPAIRLLLGLHPGPNETAFQRLLEHWSDRESLAILDETFPKMTLFRSLTLALLPDAAQERLRLAQPDLSPYAQNPDILAQLQDWSSGLQDGKPRRLRALAEMAQDRSGRDVLFIPMLDILFQEDTDWDVSREVLSALAESARTHPAAREIIEQAAVDPGLPDSLRQKAAGILARLTSRADSAAELQRLRHRIASGSERQAEEWLLRAQTELAAPALSLTERLRQEAIRESRDELQAALDSHDPDAIALTLSRLQAQLDGAQGALAPGSNALPIGDRLASIARQAKSIIFEIHWLSLSVPLLTVASIGMFSLLSLLAGMSGTLPAIVTVGLIAATAITMILGAALSAMGGAPWASTLSTLSRIGLRLLSHLAIFSTLASLYLFFDHSTSRWAAFVFLNLFSMLASAPWLNAIWIGHFKLLHPTVNARIRNLRWKLPLEIRPWADALSSTGRDRSSAIAEMLRDPQRSRPLLPAVIELLDAYDAVTTYDAVKLLAAWADPESVLALESLILRSHPQAQHAADALTAIYAAIQEQERQTRKTKDIAAAAQKLSQLASLLAQAQAVLDQVPQSLSERLRHEALRDSRDEFLAARDSHDPNAIALALSRLQAHLSNHHSENNLKP
jgi:hypothetical protein